MTRLALFILLWAAAGAYFASLLLERHLNPSLWLHSFIIPAKTSTSDLGLLQDKMTPTHLSNKSTSHPLGCTTKDRAKSMPCLHFVNGAARSSPYRSLSWYDLEPAEALPSKVALKQAECVQNAELRWKEKPEAKYGAFLSTVQPYGKPFGLGAMCDWIVGVRWHSDVAFGNVSEAPRIVFVYVPILDIFILRILPCLSKRVVIIVADEDCTAPRQLDVRYSRPWSDTMWDNLVNNVHVAHVWVSHLDVPPSAKVSPIPVGLNPEEFSGGDINSLWKKQNMPPSNILKRPLKMLVCDRVREDGSTQWTRRVAVRARCLNEWSAVCDARSGISSFVDEIKKYPFLICTRGGGIDPNPKAWTALIAGVIPIMEHFPGDTIYDGLPVVIVDDLSTARISSQTLAKWRTSLAHYFDDPASWAMVVDKLHTQYWFKLVVASWYTGRGYGWLNSTHGLLPHSSTG